MRYAQNTTVSSAQSRNEIEKTLSRYGATGFMYGQSAGKAAIAFEASNRRVKFLLPLPDPSLREFTHTSGRGIQRSPESAHDAWEQACRQRWRALALSIKAKLEAVEVGITSFEEEFMAHIVLPSGQTVGAWMTPQIENAYNNKKMPPLLDGPRA